MARFLATPRVWRSNLAGTRLTPLQLARPTRVVASYNEDYATKRQATIALVAPDQLKRLHDYVVIELEITTPGGELVTIPLGHYLVIGHDITTGSATRTGTVHLRDLTYLLHLEGFTEPITVPAGTDTGAGARMVLEAQGVPARQLNIPDSGVLTAQDWTPLPGERVLAFVTDLLAAGAMYQPWAAMDGRLTSMRMRDIASAAPDSKYHTADGAKVVPPVREPLADLSTLWNQVTVQKRAPGQDPIVATATVTDASSPVHPDRLAEALGRSRPVVLPHVIEEPMLETIDEAQAIADARLAEGTSHRQALTILTYPDRTLDGHQILDLALEHPSDGQTYYTGRWWQRRWELRLDGGAPVVERELFRTESWR